MSLFLKKKWRIRGKSCESRNRHFCCSKFETRLRHHGGFRLQTGRSHPRILDPQTPWGFKTGQTPDGLKTKSTRIFSKKKLTLWQMVVEYNPQKKEIESFCSLLFPGKQTKWCEKKCVQIHGEKLEFFDKADILLHLPTRKTSNKAFQPPLKNSKMLAPLAIPVEKNPMKENFTFH